MPVSEKRNFTGVGRKTGCSFGFESLWLIASLQWNMTSARASINGRRSASEETRFL
jgi:hypothetical protein